jgi:hypothetical protein
MNVNNTHSGEIKLSFDLTQNLNELHEYIDETIDGINAFNNAYETRMNKIEKEFELMKEEFGEIMFQLQSQLREVIEYEQTMQKETRLKLKKIGFFMLEKSKKYRKKVPIKRQSMIVSDHSVNDTSSPTENHK